jgi:hypothetical protein
MQDRETSIENHQRFVSRVVEARMLWLKGMHEDGVLVGTNWDANNCGLEVEPPELAAELLEAAAPG